MEDLVSVVVPVYNVEGYVERCLKSIIGQTYKNLEIIVVDDGSTDSSGQICDRVAATDERMTVIHQENRGLSGARNRGLDASRGEYICFIDSDDYISDLFVGLQLKCMEQSGADIVQGVGGTFTDSSTQNYESLLENYKVYDGEEMCHIHMTESKGGYGVAQNKLYRRKLFNELRFADGKLHEDEFIVYRLYYASKKVVLLDGSLYCYQPRPDGICNSPVTLKRLDSLEGMRGRMLFYEQEHKVKLMNEARVAYSQALLYWSHYILLADIATRYSVVKDLLREYRKQMKDILASPNTRIKSKGGTVIRYVAFKAKHRQLMKEAKRIENVK